jgi:hypothetical protein
MNLLSGSTPCRIRYSTLKKFRILILYCLITFPLTRYKVYLTFVTIVIEVYGFLEGKKVKLSLCLTKHHAMKVYWGVEI